MIELLLTVVITLATLDMCVLTLYQTWNTNTSDSDLQENVFLAY